MAEEGGFLPSFTGAMQSLWNWLTPGEAEAKVVPAGPDEEKALAETAAYTKANQGKYLADMYQAILNQAQARPETVTIKAEPGFYTRRGAAGSYNLDTNEIRYDPGVAETFPGVLSHELLHFLNNQTTQLPEETQHAIIKQVLGRDVHGPISPLYQPSPLSPEDRATLNQWLGRK